MSHLYQTSLQGTAKELCQSGSATEFIQPWYTPIETTPQNTGIALGGIGSSYTLTPAASTPSLSFVPGLHVTGQNSSDIALQQWFFSERCSEQTSTWVIDNLEGMKNCLDFYPLFKDNGEQVSSDVGSENDMLQLLDELIHQPSLYKINQSRFESYGTEFSPACRELLNSAPDDPNSLKALLIDYFDGNCSLAQDHQSALTGDLESDEVLGLGAYPMEKMHNHLLYPQAEIDYQSQEHTVRIKRRHTSPIVRHDAKACSSPFHYIDFELSNPSSETRVLTLVWLQDNINGYSLIKTRPGVQDAGFSLQKTAKHQKASIFKAEFEHGRFHGIQQSNDVEYGDINGVTLFGLLSDNDPDISVSAKSTFYQHQSETVLKAALATERTNDHFDRGIYTGREPLSSALCVRVTLAPHSSKSLNFVQILDYPNIETSEGISTKKYGSFFPEKQRAEHILEYAITEKSNIHQGIEKQWQQLHQSFAQSQTYHQHPREAAQMTTMAMNTLSFNAEATVWDSNDHFLVRECADYPFYNSLDVYFYGSFAMLWLLPEVDTHTMRDFKNAILREDHSPRRFYIYNNAPTAVLHDPKYEGPRATKGAVIHDLGSPFDPKPDAYDWHNVAQWKDLAPKYMLMLLRNHHFNHDKALLQECWPAVQLAMDYLIDMIPKGHSIPLTQGTDDTFDNLCSYGITIYCGSLWIAGLKAAAEIAKIVQQEERALPWMKLAQQAKEQLHQSLWDEEHQTFHFYSYPMVWDHIRNAKAVEKALHPQLWPEEDLIHSINQFIYGQQDIEPSQEEQALAFLKKHNISLEGSSFRRQKLIKKALVLSLGSDAFTESALEILHKESDDSFGDPLLADTYLEMMNLPTIFDAQQKSSINAFAFQNNFQINNPHCGYANLVTRDGQPKEAFQAQDIWIGVQHSNAAALLLSQDHDNFRTLMTQLYDNLYHKAKIPFAAPEGFNCSCQLQIEDLKTVCPENAPELYRQLQQSQWLLGDGRVSPSFPHDLESFQASCGHLLHQTQLEAAFQLIQNTGLKYTAGRYFRPGMIFALPFLMKPA